VSFSINPQVHAFDHSSLIESMDAQKDTINSARALFPGKLVAVSPVTLKPRFNPNASEDVAHSENQPATDPRQASLFAAGWTLGSINALAGADCITYYESTGPRGLLYPEKTLQTSHFPFQPGYRFPMLLVFRLLARFGVNSRVKKVINNNPLVFSALVIGDENVEMILIASHRNEPISVELSAAGSCKQLDTHLLRHPDWPDKFFKDTPVTTLVALDNTAVVTLNPLALVVIRTD
jgi:hypothetical protein